MVHHRLNEREANPNPYVNFIISLPIRDAAAQEDARQLLQALMAQVKPVMKAHQLQVNSIEEYHGVHTTIWHVPFVVHLEVKVTGKGSPDKLPFNLKFMPQERSGILTCTFIYAVIGVFDLSTVNVNS
ncbi:hypothetical protein BC835DRAFT_1412114 [Cytidiella melzeri]|nr:hypothetical protein BC835DRAFT_1412114 [Cytidiella melzeri]